MTAVLIILAIVVAIIVALFIFFGGWAFLIVAGFIWFRLAVTKYDPRYQK